MKNSIRTVTVAAAVLAAMLASSVGQAQRPEIIVQNGHLDTIWQAVFSPDGRLLASCAADQTIKLWDVAENRELRTLSGYGGPVLSVAFSPDGNTLAGGGLDKTLRLWDVTTGRLLRSLVGPAAINSIAFSPDGRILASGASDNTIRIWDVATGTSLRPLRGHSASINSVAFSPDGKILASGSSDNTISLWDVATGRGPSTLRGHSDAINSVAFSGDGRTLASGSGDGTTKLWDLLSFKELRTIKGNSPGGKAALSPDGKSLATCNDTEPGTIRLWDVVAGKEIQTLEGNPGVFTSVAFSPNGRSLVASSDEVINLWDIATAKLVRTFPGAVFDNNSQNKPDWLVVTPDGLFDGSTSALDKILWRYGPGTFDVLPVEAFFREYFSPGLLADVVAAKKPLSPPSIATLDRRQPLVQLSAEGQPNIGARNLRIRIEVAEAGADEGHSSGSGVRDARLFRNGSRVAAWRGDLALKDGKTILEATVPIVAGQNTFTAYVFNHDNIKSRDAQITVVGNESLRRAGTTYILAIGIDQYSNPAFNLKYAVSDAQIFGQELALQQEKLDAPRHVEKFFLSNAEATKSNILQTIERIAQSAQPEDSVILYFSGHGTADKDHYYLIPHDLGYDGARDRLDAGALHLVLSHSISDQDLVQSLEKIDSGHLVLVIDSTKSGQLPRSKSMSQLAYEKGMFVLTSSQSFQESFESAKINHGFLTYALIEEGLRSGRAASSDGTVTLRGWLEYAAERVPLMVSEMRGGGASQIPFLLLPRESDEQPFIVAKLDKGRGNVTR